MGRLWRGLKPSGMSAWKLSPWETAVDLLEVSTHMIGRGYRWISVIGCTLEKLPINCWSYWVRCYCLVSLIITGLAVFCPSSLIFRMVDFLGFLFR